MSRSLLALTPLMIAACAPQTPSGDASESAAAPATAVAPADDTGPAAPDRDAALRDMRPKGGAGATEEECENPVGAENPCIQGNFQPLPANPDPDEG